jgi:hypothetical protein
LLTPAAASADSISLSEAVLADTLALVGSADAVALDVACVVVAGLLLSLVVVDPPQPATNTPTPTIRTQESLALEVISRLSRTESVNQSTEAAW